MDTLLFIHILKDIWIGSSLGLSWIKLLWTVVYIGFCGEHFSISLKQMPRSAIAGKYGKLVNVSLDFFLNCHHFSFWYLNYSIFSQWKNFQVASLTCSASFLSFFLFWLKKTSQAPLINLQPQTKLCFVTFDCVPLIILNKVFINGKW